MAAIVDLTFEQLNTALGGSAISVDSAGSGHILIDASVINGPTGAAPAMTDMGVIELLAKLLYAAREAQATANTGQVAGEQLAALLQPTQQLLSDGSIQITQQFRFKMRPEENLDVAYGPNV